MKRIIMFCLLFSFLSIYVQAQNANKEEKIVIKTSAQCEQCKERIEKALAYERGVKKAELNLETKEVSVWYKPSKTTPEKIRKAISLVGYDADDVTAEPKAYSKLPACCKKPDDPLHEEHK